MDILATVPFDNILRVSTQYQEYVKRLRKNKDSQWVQVLGILKLGRILRLNKIIQFLKSTDDVKAGLKIFKMVLYLVVYMHCFTCLWWLMVRNTETWVTPIYMEYPEKFFSIYEEESVTMKYMISFHTTVQLVLGNGVLPQDSIQTILGATGIFFGAIINANIFGELSMIFQSLNKNEDAFKLKVAKMNTSMINLKLPNDLQLESRKYIYRTEPSRQSQNELKLFLNSISPSMRYKVLIIQYERIFQNIYIFMDRKEEINFLLGKLDISFYEPEFKIMNQFHDVFDKLLITGNGLCKVFKYFDTR